jgi:hypothetical protein
VGNVFPIPPSTKGVTNNEHGNEKRHGVEQGTKDSHRKLYDEVFSAGASAREPRISREHSPPVTGNVYHDKEEEEFGEKANDVSPLDFVKH